MFVLEHNSFQIKTAAKAVHYLLYCMKIRKHNDHQNVLDQETEDMNMDQHKI